MSEKLTGKRRYRFKKGLFGKESVILQVEVECSYEDFDYNTGYGHTFKSTKWRDANYNDLEGFV